MQTLTKQGPDMHAGVYLTEQMSSHADPHSACQEKHVSPTLTQGYSPALHPSWSAQVAKQLYQSSSETNPNLSSGLGPFLRLLIFINTTVNRTMIWKGIVSKNNTFLYKKDPVSPFFLFTGQGWFILFLIQHIFMSLRKPQQVHWHLELNEQLERQLGFPCFWRTSEIPEQRKQKTGIYVFTS